MEGPNYFRTAMEFFKRSRRIAGNQELAVTLQAAMTAPKFALPEGGRVLDNNLRCLPEKIRLPYPCVVIEYFHKEDYLADMAAEAALHHIDDPVLKLMTSGHCYRDKVIVIATQEGSGPIEITVVSHVPDQSSWISAPFICKMPAEKGPMFEALESGILPCTLTNDVGLSKEWFEKLAGATMRGPIKALCELCEAFAFSNISEQEIPAKKLTFTEQRKKALPYDSYRVLVVNKTERIVSAGRTETGPCGERRQSREHDRRGHDRTYKRSGKTIWINPMVVNAGVGGKIVKDYQLK